MANPEHVEIFKQGVEVWNRWRDENFETMSDMYTDLSGLTLTNVNLKGFNFEGVNLNGADLRGSNLQSSRLGGVSFLNAYLSGVDLRDAYLKDARLQHATLIETNLRGADLYQAHLSYADLSYANLEVTNFRITDLYGANLTGAKLKWAKLESMDLWETNFKNAEIGYTIFIDLDLSNTEGLESVNHNGPSSIGIDTIFRSSGKISHKFLREAGVPEIFIDYMSSLTGSAFEYYSCFISYSSRDEEFAKRLHHDLQKNGVRCWFAPEDMKIGDQIRPTIDRQIRLRDKLLVILSENSVKSEWIGDEVEGAFEEESKCNRLLLFPIRLDDTVLNTRDDWAAKIKRRRHIGDFSNWKDKASYQKAFERLLRDLKATDDTPIKDG